MSHPECRDKNEATMDREALASATLAPDYTGPFIIDDRFCVDVAELLDRLDAEQIPEEGFCQTFSPAHLDGADILDDLASNHHEDFEPEDQDAFEDAIAAFNKANEDNGTWWEDRERKWTKALILGRS